jgi:glycerophosphoryl diester phosphodiesterase
MKETELIARIEKSLKKERPMCFAHRGASGLVDGHLPAILKAAKMKEVDGIEFDVQETKDGVLIVRHDFCFSLNKREVWVKDHTYSTIKKNANKDNCAKFEDVIEKIKNCNKILDIEIKQKNIFSKVYKILKDKKIYHKVLFTTLYREIYNEIRKTDKQVVIFYGYPRDRGKNISGKRWAKFLVKLYVYITKRRLNKKIYSIMDEYNTPFISFYDKVITKEVVDILHQNNRYCIGCTINLRNDTMQKQSIKAMKKMHEQGCDIILTDYPNLYKEALMQ